MAEASALNAQAGDLVRMWNFTPGSRALWEVKQRLSLTARRAIRFPQSVVLKPAAPSGRTWAVYFIYAPQGAISEHHAYTLAQLGEQGFARLVVVAGLSTEEARARLGPLAEALIWKAQPGYDFSAYTLGLRHLAKRDPGATAVFLNDSVLGPFGDLAAFVARARWRLTGFTGSGYWGGHLQSYAFILKGIDRRLARQLIGVFSPFWAFDRFEHVVTCQEIPLARTAAAHGISVGAFWYHDENPSVQCAEALMDDGFPFLKKSLFGKNVHWGAGGSASALLAARGYAPDPAV